MDTLFEKFTSFEWWISVVLVGLLINLASAYFKPLLDKFLAKRSEKKREKVETERRYRDYLINRLMDTYDERHSYQIEMIDAKLEAVFQFLLGFFLVLIVQVYQEKWNMLFISIFNLISILSIFSGFHSYINYHKMRTILLYSKIKLAKKKEEEAEVL